MVLKTYQQTIIVGRVYEVSAISIGQIGEQLQPNMFVNVGTVDLYGANGNVQPTSIAELVLNVENTNVGGNIPFAMIPRYLTLVQNTGTSTEIIVSGLNVTDLGAI